MFYVYNFQSFRYCGMPAGSVFKVLRYIQAHRAKIKKTPTYAEYVERHQKHNMKIFSIF